jgi:hypothetical protein
MSSFINVLAVAASVAVSLALAAFGGRQLYRWSAQRFKTPLHVHGIALAGFVAAGALAWYLAVHGAMPWPRALALAFIAPVLAYLYFLQYGGPDVDSGEMDSKLAPENYLELTWEAFDPAPLAALAREQHPGRAWLSEALARCITAASIEDYIFFLDPGDAAVKWEVKESIPLEDPDLGPLEVDVLADGRLGGVALLNVK